MILSIDFNKFLSRVAFIFRTIVLNSISFCKSGHLGLPLGSSSIGSKLFWYALNIYSKKSSWLNRDKFVLSAGHGSIFLYTFLFLTGYSYTMADMFTFRKLNSKTPGHPEFDLKIGIESTTGPLGQGVANSVGISISDNILSKTLRLKRIKGVVLDCFTICFAGDGCLQEGIAQEAMSLAGNLKLKNLIIVYDSNDVTLDCSLQKTQKDDFLKRFLSVKFDVRYAEDNKLNNFLNNFISLKYSTSKKPKLLISKTVIGQGIDDISGFSKAHGESGIAYIHKYDNLMIKTFKNPNLVRYKFLLNAKSVFSKRLFKYKKWLNTYFKLSGSKRLDSLRLNLKKLKITFNFINSKFNFNLLNISTRQCGNLILNKLARLDNFIVSGSADLFSSCKNFISSYKGVYSLIKNLRFGVREHAMGGVANGLTYQNYFKIFVSTFLTFSDYLRPALRLSALSKIPTNFIFTHDSIAVGKDGPTHQPIETLSALRLIPNLNVLRPFNYWETLGSYLSSYNQKSKPTALVLSRQDINFTKVRSPLNHINGCLQGTYTLIKETRKLKVIILSTGSDVSLAFKVHTKFCGFSRLISVPNFNKKTMHTLNKSLAAYLTRKAHVIIVESGVRELWHLLDIPKRQLHIFGLDSFGKSGSPDEVLDFFKLRSKYILNFVRNKLNR